MRDDVVGDDLIVHPHRCHGGQAVPPLMPHERLVKDLE